MERARSQLGIVFLELNWEDTVSFDIPDEDLIKCVKFIHTARTSGGSALVHCAQVSVLGMVLVSLVPSPTPSFSSLAVR